jgi:flagellar hook-associated protein 1 FlgK
MSNLALNIAASALDASQAGMDVVSQDLANVNTPGYVREQTDMSAVPGGVTQVGDGVTVTGVSQISSTLAQASANAANGVTAQWSALTQILSNAQTLFPEPSGGGIQSQLTSFWNAWDGIANDPTALAPRQELVSTAQEVVGSISQTYQSLVSDQNQTVSELQATVAEVNRTLAQVASLNQSISTTGAAGGDINSLTDQMNQFVSTLANDIGATAQTQPGGTVTIRLGGITLVQGTQQMDTLSVSTTGGATTLAAQVNSAVTGGPVPVTSGTVAGQIAGLARLGSYEASMNSVASALATTVNSQLAAGGYWNSAGTLVTPGPPLFVNTATGTTAGVNASNIEVSSTIASNPMEIAASSATATGSNDGSNAQILAQDFNIAGGPDQTYQGFIAQLGADVQSATNELTAKQASSQAADNANLQISGVNPNEESVQMVAYQNAFQAATKVVTAVQTMMQSLLSAV